MEDAFIYLLDKASLHLEKPQALSVSCLLTQDLVKTCHLWFWDGSSIAGCITDDKEEHRDLAEDFEDGLTGATHISTS